MSVPQEHPEPDRYVPPVYHYNILIDHPLNSAAPSGAARLSSPFPTQTTVSKQNRQITARATSPDISSDCGMMARQFADRFAHPAPSQ